MTEVLADYRAVGASESLQSFAHNCNSHRFPLYLTIRKKGINLRSLQRLVYVHERKKIPFASCVSDKNRSAYTIPVGRDSGLRLLPAARPSNPARILPSELLACKAAPPKVLLVSKSFVASAKGKRTSTVALKEGDLLFPQEIMNKKKATAFLLAGTEKGLVVTIDLMCTGRFSVSFGPDFDLIDILKTFKGIIKLPMEVSICRRSTSESESVVRLQGIRVEWALCGVMTGELGEEKGKVQFLYKAEVPASLPYSAQKMVPRDSSSKTAVQLKVDYEKAARGQGVEDIYDVPALAIYETVELAMSPNPAYGSYGGGAAATVDDNAERPPFILPSVKREGSHQLPPASNWRSASPETTQTEPAVKLPLFEASAIDSVTEKHPIFQATHVEDIVSASQRLRHTKVAVKVPIADTPLKKLPLEQHPEADVHNHEALSRDRNVAFLKSLGVDMVQRLLSGMNLAEHRDRFQAEHVDGEILACCDSECLQELGVTSRIQQLRLTKLIDGTHSAVKFLNK